MQRWTSPPGEGLNRYQRLRRRQDFVRCYRSGGKRHGALVSIHFHSNEVPEARLGITASRKVGNSVVRHRLKRRVREVFRRYGKRERLGQWDVVVHLKPRAAHVTQASLAVEIERLLASIPRPRRGSIDPSSR